MFFEKAPPYNIKPFLVLNIIIGSSHPILLNLGKTDGKILFSSISVALLIELLKLVISGVLFMKELKSSNKCIQYPSGKHIALYSVPAFLYMVNNNLVTHSQNHMDPATFHMLNNLKIVATAVLYRIVIKKHLTLKRWLSVFILFMAGLLHSGSGLKSDFEGSSNELFITWTGIYVVSTYCLTSAFAGVYTEAVLKNYGSVSIHLQNLIMYSFGVITNGLVYVSVHFSTQNSTSSFFEGFSVSTWLIILTQSINGISISFVMKHASNITRLFVIGSSILLTSVLSFLVLGIQLNLLFYASFMITVYALYLYNS